MEMLIPPLSRVRAAHALTGTPYLPSAATRSSSTFVRYCLTIPVILIFVLIQQSTYQTAWVRTPAAR